MSKKCGICDKKKERYKSDLIIDIGNGKRAIVIVSYCKVCDKNPYPAPRVEEYKKENFGDES